MPIQHHLWVFETAIVIEHCASSAPDWSSNGPTQGHFGNFGFQTDRSTRSLSIMSAGRSTTPVSSDSTKRSPSTIPIPTLKNEKKTAAGLSRQVFLSPITPITWWACVEAKGLPSVISPGAVLYAVMQANAHSTKVRAHSRPHVDASRVAFCEACRSMLLQLTARSRHAVLLQYSLTFARFSDTVIVA